MKGSPARILAGFLGLALLTVLFPIPSQGMTPDRTFSSEPASGSHVTAQPVAPQEFSPDGGPGMPPPSPYISIKFKEGQEELGLLSAQQLHGASFVRKNDLTKVLTLRAPPGIVPADLAQRLARDPRVLWAEPVLWRRLSVPPAAPLTPNDTNYASFQKWYYDVMEVPDVWGLETGKSTVVIAVLDSGVLCSHPDLAANIWQNPNEIAGNGVDDDGNGAVDDINGYDFVGAETGKDVETLPDLPGDSDPCFKAGDPGLGNGQDDDNDGGIDNGVSHGTMVAGVVAGIGNNNQGVAGMCWGCRIMPVRIANPEGSVRSSDTADAITYAARNGAKIINLSLGGPEISRAEIAAIDTAINTFGVLIVAAAGNENQTPIAYPARLSNVLAVGASARTNTKGRAPFSNWGTGGSGNRQVDVVAPGIDIVSTGVNSVAAQNSGQGAAGSPSSSVSASGTSFSAPLVSGLAGLLLSKYPTLTAQQIRSVIKNEATPLPDDPSDSPNAGPGWAGAGLLNALGSFNAAAQPPPPAPTPTTTPGPSPTPTPTPIPTPSATPLPANSAPQLQSPLSGTLLVTLGATLRWNLAAGATQYQIQVVPFNNDGPAINLIRNVDVSYTVEQPVFGAGPYVMLPGITYTWRVRSTTATVSVDASSPLWGLWSQDFTFKTRTTSSSRITLVAPSVGSAVDTLTPVLQWANSDQNIFYYEVQVSKDPNFSALGPVAMLYWELRHGGATTPVNSYAIPPSFPLEQRTTYFWRVRPRVQGDGTPAAWSQSFTFSTR